MEKLPPDGKISKQVLIKGKWGRKPNENSKCTITITESHIVNINNKIIVIGDNDEDFWRTVELCLLTMNVGEKSKFLLDVNNEKTDLVIELIELELDEYIYEMNAPKKIHLALYHKEKGNIHFKENKIKEAALRFIKGLKILHSIPFDAEKKPDSIDDIPVSDIKKYKENIYNNLCSCYFKKKEWDRVIDLCLKVLEYNNTNVKALYKLGVAYQFVRNFEKSFEAFEKVLILEPENRACIEHLTAVKSELKKAEIRVTTMIKKMFP